MSDEPQGGKWPTDGTGRAAKRPSFHAAFGFGGLSFAVSGILALGSSIFTARIYGLDVVGEFALAYAPTGTVWFLSSVREQPALIRLLAPLAPRDPRVTGLFLPVFVFSTGLTLLACLLAALGAYLLFQGPIGRPDLFAPAVVSLAGYLLFTNPAWNLDGVFSAFRAGRDLFWIRTHQMATYLAIAVGLSLFLPTVWGLILATVASWVTSLAHRLYLSPKWIRWAVPLAEIRDGFRELPHILRFGLKVTPGSLASGVSDQLATWILGVYGSLGAVGAWNRAWALSQRFVELNHRITEMVFPTLVERHVGEDRPGFDRALVDSQRYVAVAMLLPAAAGGGAAAGIMALFGPGFASAADALALVLLVPAITTMSNIQSDALLAVGRPLATTALATSRMAATIVLTVPFTIAFGVTGAALGMTLGCCAQLAIQFGVLRRHLSRPLHELWPIRQLAGLAFAYLAGFAIAHLVYSLLPGLLGLIAALGAGALVYAAALLLVGGLLPRDRTRVQAIVDTIAPGSKWARLIVRPLPST
ncbi:MAG: lipopolysaccharide biosynthesis protein [Candidatus Limnocylindria bacterium]